MQAKNATVQEKTTDKVEPKVENQNESLLKVKVKSSLRAGGHMFLQCH